MSNSRLVQTTIAIRRIAVLIPLRSCASACSSTVSEAGRSGGLAVDSVVPVPPLIMNGDEVIVGVGDSVSPKEE